MKPLLITILAMLAVQLAFADVYVFTGTYQGKDLYVKNPFAPDGVGFCVFEVRVNGEITSDEVNSSAFAIDLSLFDLQLGAPVEVIIRTKDSCEPRVINPDAIAPKSTFELQSMVLNEERLAFATKNESGPLPFIVEQFKWNKWVPVATLEGKAGAGESARYEVVVPVHSGENVFRVTQHDSDGARSSERFEMKSDFAEVRILEEKFTTELRFSAKTDYEVFDAYGVLIGKGIGDRIDASKWPSGTYYVNFDRFFGQIAKKR